jgi:MYXO-CTERM domain-containing protein
MARAGSWSCCDTLGPVSDPWKQLPRAAAIVYVGVLAAGSGRPARAEQEQPEAAPANASDLDDVPQQAPTCGPSCHGGGEIVEPVYEEPDPVAPTCGPECHEGRGGGPIEPPPVGEGKKGCAVESVDDEQGLALLGLGLLAGVAMRRRRGDESR